MEVQQTVGPFQQRPTNRSQHFWIVFDVFDLVLAVDVNLAVILENRS